MSKKPRIVKIMFIWDIAIQEKCIREISRSFARFRDPSRSVARYREICREIFGQNRDFCEKSQKVKIICQRGFAISNKCNHEITRLAARFKARFVARFIAKFVARFFKKNRDFS